MAAQPRHSAPQAAFAAPAASRSMSAAAALLALLPLLAIPAACAQRPSPVAARTPHAAAAAPGAPMAAPLEKTEPREPGPDGTRARPFLVKETPFSTRHTTEGASDRAIGALGCLPGARLGGPEVYYRVEVKEPALLRARVDRIFGERVNVDVALMTEDGASCVAGHDLALRERVEPGAWLVVVDTWFHEGAGIELSGSYNLEIGLEPPPGPCAMEEGHQLMLWKACSDGLDCAPEGIGPMGMPTLAMPAEGPVVLEAHLVTDAERFEGGWPQNIRDGLERHFELTQRATGYVMERRGVWAPAGEGINVSRFGEGSSGEVVPVADEPWYVNMYWAFPPPRGVRMIVMNPANGKAVVAAAGYEKGPGSNTAIGGVTEEIHHHLGTRHRSPMIVGFATDQGLPLGPIDCRWPAEQVRP